MKLLCVRGRQQEYEDPNTKTRYWSVSEVLKVLDPKAFEGVDPFVLAAAQTRGTDLHVLFALTMLWRIGTGAKPIIPGGTIGKYYAGIEKFQLRHKPIPIRVEAQGINDKLKTAGTLDFHGTIDDEPTEWIIDLKTGPPRAVHSAQLIGGYKRLSGSEKAKRFGSLYIRKDGTYKLVEHTHSHIDWAWFMGGLSVLNGRRYHGIR